MCGNALCYLLILKQVLNEYNKQKCSHSILFVIIMFLKLTLNSTDNINTDNKLRTNLNKSVLLKAIIITSSM